LRGETGQEPSALSETEKGEGDTEEAGGEDPPAEGDETDG
jgi:hypothetical protein